MALPRWPWHSGACQSTLYAQGSRLFNLSEVLLVFASEWPPEVGEGRLSPMKAPSKSPFTFPFSLSPFPLSSSSPSFREPCKRTFIEASIHNHFPWYHVRCDEVCVLAFTPPCRRDRRTWASPARFRWRSRETASQPAGNVRRVWQSLLRLRSQDDSQDGRWSSTLARVPFDRASSHIAPKTIDKPPTSARPTYLNLGLICGRSQASQVS